MKKPWQVWTAFAVSLVIGLIGMSWLTARAIDLDRAEAIARREAERARQQAELQERIAMALWRMDWMLTPLIAQEATRPSFIYRPFLEATPGKGTKASRPAIASPLLTQTPDYVMLNFDVSAKNGWTSPQSPDERYVPEAVSAGVSADTLSRNRGNLRELGQNISFDDLLRVLPDTLLPAQSGRELDGNLDATQWAANDAIANGFFAQQLDTQQTAEISQRASPAQREMPPSPLGGDRQSTLPPNFPASQRQQAGPQHGQQRAAQQRVGEQQTEPPGGGPNYRPPHAAEQTRAQQEWQRRNLGMQNVARSQRAQMMANSVLLPDPPSEREGVSRGIWLGSRLILARRVVSGNEVRIQGCWLDWSEIKRRLRSEVADLFPEIELLPVANDETVPPGRLLATLPVQISVPESISAALTSDAAGTANLSAIRISLVIAWCCVLLGSVAVAVMLRGVLALSERRAAFVSAVTHELRSPLTTFRMYAEMLAEGMVRDPRQRDHYLATLRHEADRLSHLVDNVLQYARLERGRKKRNRVKMEMKALMRQTTERLPQRARLSGMELHETLAAQDAKAVVLTDPAAVEQILFNLVDNACKYAACAEDHRIHLHWSVGNRVVQVRVSDHGPGIHVTQAKKLFLPFSKSDQEAAQSAPGIGLGLALCRRLAAEIGGQLHFDSSDNTGAAFLLELPLASRAASQ